ncbi:hypothetical protein QBC34DRAFT_356803 [Podospora aff. communis PSN243]|uniref:DUF7730 domain-containing protein n=1 Tax=Podospora aff. communis PSN243 TaxID=3040156 RepID=A0AAV9GHC1_9PEZI|nr:hypothetical protein QBC34DRAFT_356803 [Podospora aff. communis PSN243]
MSSTPPFKDPLSSMQTQDASPFFRLPLELRRSVYTHAFDFSACHLHSSPASDGTPTLRITACVAPTASAEDNLDGSERCPVKGTPGHRKWPVPSQIFKRRAQSSWGPHWMCEELALYPKDCGEDVLEERSVALSRHFTRALKVCRRMFWDLIGEAMVMAEFHIAGLRTLKALLEVEEPSADDFDVDYFIRSRIRNLSITLRAPLAFFNDIEKSRYTSQQVQGHSSSSSLKDEGDVAFWSRVPSILLPRAPHLRRLQLWLDHDGEEYWSVVNEREILGPMETLATSNPSLNLVCILPKAHPAIEDRQRHFLPEDEEHHGQSSSGFEIRRILRQRYRVLMSDVLGREYMEYVIDFPHTHPRSSLFPTTPRDELEQHEAAGWRRGINVIRAAAVSRGFRYSKRSRWLASPREVEAGEFLPLFKK